MGRKNSPSERERELQNLIAQYEAVKAKNESLYLDGDQLADIADLYASERKFKEAQEVITYGLGLHPGHTDLMVEQAYLFLDLNQPQKAKEVAELITDTYSSNVKLLLAELLLNEGKLDAADQMLDSIEEEEKNDLGILVDIVYLYTDLGYPEKGVQWLKRGAEMYKDDEDFLAATADCYGAAGAEYIEQAIVVFNKLIDKNPYNPAYWVGLAKCQFATKDFDKAIESCDFAIAADEEFGEAHIIKAHSLFHLENIEGAIVEYRKALKYKTLSPEFTYMFIGLAYTQQENWAEANESYSMALRAIEENGNGSSPLFKQSTLRFPPGRLGRSPSALPTGKRARPPGCRALPARGTHLYGRGQFRPGPCRVGIGSPLCPRSRYLDGNRQLQPRVPHARERTLLLRAGAGRRSRVPQDLRTTGRRMPRPSGS